MIKLMCLVGCTRNKNILLQSSEIFLPPINKYNYGVKCIHVSFASRRYVDLTVEKQVHDAMQNFTNNQATNLLHLLVDAFDLWRIVSI